MKKNKQTAQKNQVLGFTLIELLVSMTIGLFLIGGLMSMYLGSREGDKTRTELSDIEANARVALEALRQSIQHAGYTSTNYIPLDKPFYKGSTIPNATCRDGRKLIISGSTATDGTPIAGLTKPPTELVGYTKDAATGDIITVVARPDNPNKGPIYTDCGTIANATNTFVANSINRAYQTSNSTLLNDKDRQVACSADATVGVHNPFEAKMYSAFFLKQNTGQPKQLMCYGSRSPSSIPLAIADNIENMQIRYGVLNGVGGRTSYKTATQVGSNWESVVSVQIALLVGSSKANVLENAHSRTYQLLDVAITKPATDHRMYKVYTTTINLPNRAQRDF